MKYNKPSRFATFLFSIFALMFIIGGFDTRVAEVRAPEKGLTRSGTECASSQAIEGVN